MTPSDDGADAGPGDEPAGRDDEGGDEAAGDAASGEAGPRKRRRRRRRRGEPGAEAGAPAEAGAEPPRDQPAREASPPREARPPQPPSGERPPAERRQRRERGRDERGPRPQAQAQPQGQPGERRERRDWAAREHVQRDAAQRDNAPRDGGRDHAPRDGAPREGGRDSASREGGRESAPRDGGRDGAPREGGRDSAPREGRRERRTREDRPPRPSRDDAPAGGELAAAERYALQTGASDGPTARLDPRRPVAPTDDLDLEGPSTPAIPWGKDDDGPAAEVTLAADLPAEPPADDPDPVSFPARDAPSASLGDDVASVAGVRFVAGGRIQWCDAGDADYAAGDRVLVDAERGARLATIAVPPARRAVRDRGMRRVIRRATDQDLRGERDGDADRAHALRVAKDKAAQLRLPLKVFRVELGGGRGGRVNVYYTTDERLDLRDFIREVAQVLGARIELRQLGVRDEAKAVGGIGSCGLTLCCTTWLPDFVPVSIKMAKDQGLVLSPTKVSGQCGRLKCCLVYEQAAYAELRKGLPKLGKRVIGARGEGRVVEVDVLRQRVRVSYGAGDTEVVPAAEVKPLFPSGNQPAARRPDQPDGPDDDAADSADDLPAASDPALPDPLPDASSPALDLGDLPDDPPR